ncbi:MAG TPA: ankyrin repeat domain-containing protein [Pyrinomonadaceae bacterium]|jgi:hypothetical protein
MKLLRALSLLLLCLAPLAVLAQDDARQALNNQLWEAARKGDAEAVKRLLDAGADVNAKFRYGATALFKAADGGHLEVVKVLLERGADARVKDTFYGATALTWALMNNRFEVVRVLLDRNGEGVDEVLMAGVEGGQLELVRMALARGGAKPETLSTALAEAERGKHAEIVELLKKAGALPPPKADFQVDAETLKLYEGTYRNERGSEVNVVLREGKLNLVARGQPLTLGAFDKTSFRPMEFEGVRITFNVEGGKTVSFDFKQAGNDSIYKRVEPPKQP